MPGWTDADLEPIVSDILRTVPTRACPDDELAAWQRAFLDAAVDAGFPRSSVGPFTQNVRDGMRWNAAFAFLDPVRSRITVIDRLLADRLVIDGDRAQAVVGGAREIRAERFVLCAGVYGSPSILLRSASRCPASA